MGDNVFVKSLFENVEGFEDAQKQFKQIKQRRVHFRKPTYTKKYKNDEIQGVVVSDETKWGKLREIHIKLANYFPLPLLNGDLFNG